MLNIRYTLDHILKLVNPSRIQGKTKVAELTGIASLGKAQAGDISFLGNQKYKSEVFKSKATLILIPEGYVGSPHADQVFLTVENPSKALDCICRDIEKTLRPSYVPGIHPSAYIDASATVSPKAYVGPLCVIEKGAVIKEGVVLCSHVFVGQAALIKQGSILQPHVSILSHSEIGRHCYIDAGVVIGSEGYGYETENSIHRRSPQIGRVVLEDDVDVGANTTIDRARFYETRVGQGTKIDNLVQIGHNVSIGKNCFIVALVGIAGSTEIEDSVVIGGQAGLAGHLKIGTGSMIGAQTGLNHDLEPNSVVRGTPAFPYMLAHRIDVLKKRLPELFKRVDNLEKTFAYLTTDVSKQCFLKSDAKVH